LTDYLFLQTGEGQELNSIDIQGFNSTPAVLNDIDDQFYKGFASLVNGYWALLIRYVQAAYPGTSISNAYMGFVCTERPTRRPFATEPTVILPSFLSTRPSWCLEGEILRIRLNLGLEVDPFESDLHGRRYREIYYWDSFWILEGLLKSELNSYAQDLLLNFMDLIDLYGFLPNGGRKYYLNRSQPPVFTQVSHHYFGTAN